MFEADGAGIVGVFAEGGAGGGGVAVEDTAAADGQIEPLVRIEREGIGFADAGECVARGGGDRGDAAVGAVDVEPKVVGAGEIGDGADGVDGSGAGGPGAGDDAERQVAGGAIFGVAAGEVGEVHAE